MELPKEIAESLNIVEVSKVTDLFDGVFFDDIRKMKKEVSNLTAPKKTKQKTGKEMK